MSEKGRLMAFWNSLLELVKRRVKPHRDTVRRLAHRAKWWQYGDWRPGLYAAIAGLSQVIAVPLTTKYLVPQLVPCHYEFDQSIIVIVSDSPALLAVLSSGIHCAWSWACTTTSPAGSLRYNPSLCFQTFPFPHQNPELCYEGLAGLYSIGSRYNESRI